VSGVGERLSSLLAPKLTIRPDVQRTTNAASGQVQEARNSTAKGLSDVWTSWNRKDVVGQGLCGSDECLLFEAGGTFFGSGELGECKYSAKPLLNISTAFHLRCSSETEPSSFGMRSSWQRKRLQPSSLSTNWMRLELNDSIRTRVVTERYRGPCWSYSTNWMDSAVMSESRLAAGQGWGKISASG